MSGDIRSPAEIWRKDGQHHQRSRSHQSARPADPDYHAEPADGFAVAGRAQAVGPESGAHQALPWTGTRIRLVQAEAVSRVLRAYPGSPPVTSRPGAPPPH